jgi:hypothetical protein
MTALRITEASPEAVDFVMSNLWQRGRDELGVLDISDEAARAIIAHQRAIGAPTMALWVDGRPVVILGLMHTGEPRAMRTWFQATEEFSDNALAITQQLRDSMAQFADARGLDYIEIVSPCVHPLAGRWFKALGFDFDVDRYMMIGQNRLYRYVRHFKGGENVLLPSERT